MMPDKNLYIPFEFYSYIGGPTTFMRNLKEYLDAHNYNYANKLSNADGIFFPISFDRPALNKIKKSGGRIIQRLDGIWYPEKHGPEYKELNRYVRDIYINYADHVVFQSEYSRRQCFAMLGEIPEDRYSLIYNGVDQSRFFPDESPHNSDLFRIVTTGNFRNKDMIEPVIHALDSLAGDYKFEFDVIGPIRNNNLASLLKRDYTICHGPLGRPQIADKLRHADIFVYSHLNPPCPNSVLEAISSGLPVVGYDSGSMSELCHFSKELLAYVSDDIFQSYDDFDAGKLAEKFRLCIDNYEEYKTTAMRHSRDYSFEKCGKAYLDVFNDVMSKPPVNKGEMTRPSLTEISKYAIKKFLIKVRK
ncbi:MAG: glycosyltransferase family 4 protein [Candidatus Kapaibacterium sp.]